MCFVVIDCNPTELLSGLLLLLLLLLLVVMLMLLLPVGVGEGEGDAAHDDDGTMIIRKLQLGRSILYR